MEMNKFVELDNNSLDMVSGGSVTGGVAVLGTTIGTCATILGSGASLLCGVGLVAACAPAALVIGVAGAAIGGVMIGQGIVNGEL